MPEKNPRDVHAARTTALWGIRGCALALAVCGAYLALKRVLFAVGSGEGSGVLRTWEGVGESHSLYRGLAMLVVAAVVGAASRRLAKWVVSASPYVCPNCGYEPTRTSDPARCPECGLEGVFTPEGPRST